MLGWLAGAVSGRSGLTALPVLGTAAALREKGAWPTQYWACLKTVLNPALPDVGPLIFSERETAVVVSAFGELCRPDPDVSPPTVLTVFGWSVMYSVIQSTQSSRKRNRQRRDTIRICMYVLHVWRIHIHHGTEAKKNMKYEMSSVVLTSSQDETRKRSSWVGFLLPLPHATRATRERGSALSSTPWIFELRRRQSI